MKYIETSDGKLHLNTLRGTAVVSNRSFNYHKIKKLLKKGAKGKEILPLLEQPAMPDGIYEAFLIENKNLMYYIHTTTTNTGGPTSTVRCLNGDNHVSNVNAEQGNFVGMYLSVKDILEDWPEYAL